MAVDLAASAGPNGNLHNAVPIIVVSVVVMLLVRRVVGDRERRAQVAERERDVAAREAVVEERARIARELHDVIAHHVSMMVVQAGAERRVLGDANASTREVLETVEQHRPQRSDRDAPPARHASRRRERAARTPARARRRADARRAAPRGRPSRRAPASTASARELPVGIELSAYRIVQEALTNALKHAGDAHATVHIRYGTDSLEFEIADDGAGRATLAAGGGHGLVGMRERVALYGGRFDASHSPGGGFAVRVVLPIR